MSFSVKKILYVDDSPTMRQIVDLVFKQAGFDVMLAEDAMHALNYLECNHFDIIITDFNMPKMNGIEFTRQAKLLPYHRAWPSFGKLSSRTSKSNNLPFHQPRRHHKD